MVKKIKVKRVRNKSKRLLDRGEKDRQIAKKWKKPQKKQYRRGYAKRAGV